MSNREQRREDRSYGLLQLPLLVVLVVLWMLLWGSISLLTILTGIVLAVVVNLFFYLPPVEFSGRFNLFWFLVFLVRFAGELLLGSFQVAFQAVTPKGIERNSVIAVRMRTRSDFIMTLTAITLSLVPGSLAIDADRLRHVLYIHVLNTLKPDDVEVLRGRALGVERRLARALGSHEDVRRAMQ